VFRSRAEGASPLRIPNPNAFAYPVGRDSFADHVDGARPVTVRHDAWGGDLARAPLAALHVRRLDAGRRKSYAHLAARRNRRINLVDPKHVSRGPIFLVESCAHSDSLSPLTPSGL